MATGSLLVSAEAAAAGAAAGAAAALAAAGAGAGDGDDDIQSLTVEHPARPVASTIDTRAGSGRENERIMGVFSWSKNLHQRPAGGWTSRSGQGTENAFKAPLGRTLMVPSHPRIDL
jgi:hypothetical protein